MPKEVRNRTIPRREGKIYLEEWLAYRKMTAEKLAARMETSKSVVSKLMNGKQRYNQDWLEFIAYVLDCEVRELYAPPQDPTPNMLLSKMTPKDRKTAINVLHDLAGVPKPN